MGSTGQVVLADINAAMLRRGRSRLLDRGIGPELVTVQCNAEALPFPARSFEGVTIALGLRNVTHKELALAEMRRVLRPGGRLAILEFCPEVLPVLRPIYEAYSFRVLPWLGERVADDADSYRYLAESIRMHPDPRALEQMMREAGLERCTHTRLSAGVVAVHRGVRL